MKMRLAALTMALAAAFSASAIHAQEAEPAKAEPVQKESSDDNASKAPMLRPLSVQVDLLSDTRLDGTLTNATSLEMQTSFGTASIPLSEVAGIRFASADSASTTVVMLNGDSITGATNVKQVTVDTEWGSAQINGQNITSMLFVPGLKWNPDTGLNGTRWKLVNETSSTPSTVTSPAASSGSSSSSSSSNSVPSSGSYQPSSGTRYYNN